MIFTKACILRDLFAIEIYHANRQIVGMYFRRDIVPADIYFQFYLVYLHLHLR